MSDRARELLWDYALRTLAGDERKEVEAELERSFALRAELAELRELVAALPLTLPPVRPPPAVKKRLLQSIAAPEPFTPWLEKLANLVDVSLDRARELMSKAYDPKAWKPGGLDGMSIIRIRGGARTEKAMVCLLRAVPGFNFPHHRHLGEEQILVLQGGFCDSLGNVTVRPGDIVTHPEGSEHHFVVDPGEDCIALTVVQGGVEFAPAEPTA